MVEKASGKVVSFPLPHERPTSTGDGNNGDGQLEARVAKLEASVAHIERDVSELRSDMRDVRDRTITIESTMATKGFVFSIYVAVGAFLTAVIVFQNQVQTLLGMTGG